MPATRLTMRKIRETLRLRLEAGLSYRQISASTKILLLWEDYTQRYPNRCYSYSQFCDRYRHWLGQQKRSMRQVHKAGEKLFVDYAGQLPLR